MASKKPKFRDLTFKTEAKFKSWLNKTKDKKIELKDMGQDMQNIFIHKSGEILHCDFHCEIYNGKFVNLKELHVGKELELWDNRQAKFITYGRLIIEKVN